MIARSETWSRPEAGSMMRALVKATVPTNAGLISAANHAYRHSRPPISMRCEKLEQRTVALRVPSISSRKV